MSWRDRPAAPFVDDRDQALPSRGSDRDVRSRSREPSTRPPPRDFSYNNRPPPRRDEYNSRSYGRDGYAERPAPPPRREHEKAPPSQVLGVFGLSVQTRETDLDYEFSRFGTVESVNIVYDQRTERSRGFGFIRMSSTEEAEKCIENLNGMDLQGRRIRVDFSTTNRPHNPTPGAYMGQRRPAYDDREQDPRARSGPRDGYRDDRSAGVGRSYSDRPPMNRDYDHYDGGRKPALDEGRTGRYSRDRERSVVRDREASPRRARDHDYRSASGRRTSISPPPRERDPRADRSFRTYDDAPPAGGDMRY
ncbi:hypothetical protein QFC22_003053 [Naganishia vaughanmartiniae]|uniref:Uncharacterized protein n=1 Tax=Naganishia vaughanmartiniae TaxID=1424756 RepID=A0ACC2X9R7_9TREE|nr:hypothetical protein QFC22_003053 [Naganishia vaughanmartiniae]